MNSSQLKRFTCAGVLAVILCTMLSGDAPAAKTLPAAIPLTGQLILMGLRLLAPQILEIPFHVRFTGTITGNHKYDVEISTIKDRIAAIDERLKTEQNEILREQLNAMRQSLQEDKRRNELLAEQNRTLALIYDQQIQVFRYQKARDEAVLRKEIYEDLPADKLVVVVADFSSGTPDQGREIADEIANHLNTLKDYGIDIHVMVGEIKPGVIIRSEEMARDVGKHFPSGTDYVVIWGSMSPRTVGRYHAHITCVQKILPESGKPESGKSVTLALKLESAELPLKADAETDQREAYERLIGVTCAAIPNCYAAHQINREKTPDLEKFFKLLGENEPETKKFKEHLEPFTRWTHLKEGKGKNALRRISDVSPKQPYPLMIVNENDDSIMVLITDEKGQPQRFRSAATGKEEIVYIDVLEVNVGQFARFLNNNKGDTGEEDGGVKWLKLFPRENDMDNSWNSLTCDDKGVFTPKSDFDKRRAVVNVNWFGARAYCKWAGKELPREQEWQAAAAPDKEGEFPWGKESPNKSNHLCQSGFENRTNIPGGEFPMDRSRIGCFDMGGNVAEWCANYFKEGDSSKRAVCGGCWDDKKESDFQIKSKRAVEQVAHNRWVGFRGVLRFQVD